MVAAVLALRLFMEVVMRLRVADICVMLIGVGSAVYLVGEVSATWSIACHQMSGIGRVFSGNIQCKGYDPFQAWGTVKCVSCTGGNKNNTPLTHDYYNCVDNDCQLYCGAGADFEESDPFSYMDRNAFCIYVETAPRMVCIPQG